MEKKYEIEIEEIPPLESDRIMDDSMTVGVAQFLKGEYSVQHLIEDSYEYLINKESLKESVVTERPLDILRKGMKKYYNNELIDKFSVYQFKKDALNGVKGKVVSILDEARLEDCSIVVFPENSMMSEYVPKLQHYADFYNSIIIYGEEHLPGDQSVYINRIGVIFPHRGAIRQVIKNKPSEYERDVELIKAQEIPVFKVFRTPLGNFMAFHGNDYRTYNEYIDHFIKEQDLNFLVIISNYYWNKDELNNLLKKSVEQHIPIIFANTALFGGSNIYPLNKKGLKPKCENILIQKWPKDRLYDIVEQDLVVDEKEEKKQQEIQAQVDRFKKIF
jgi:predicted amidohydrolase